jgi:hypothetical protein
VLRRVVLRYDFELQGKFEFNRKIVTRGEEIIIYGMESAAKHLIKFCTSSREIFERCEITISTEIFVSKLSHSGSLNPIESYIMPTYMFRVYIDFPGLTEG